MAILDDLILGKQQDELKVCSTNKSSYIISFGKSGLNFIGL